MDRVFMVSLGGTMVPRWHPYQFHVLGKACPLSESSEGDWNEGRLFQSGLFLSSSACPRQREIVENCPLTVQFGAQTW